MTESSAVAVILIGGYSKGTRFRPLSMDLPKPFFPVGGKPMIHHQLSALASLGTVKEVFLLGFYEEQTLKALVEKAAVQFEMKVTYLKEPAELGTAGGLVHFSDTLFKSNPKSLILLHGDIACSFPLKNLVEYHSNNNPKGITIMGTHVLKSDAHRFGCIVTEKQYASGKVLHYAEKPVSDVSNLINAGVYVIDPQLVKRFPDFKEYHKQISNVAIMDRPSYEISNDENRIRFERDVLSSLALLGAGDLWVYVLESESDFWRQCKSAASAIQCSQDYYSYYKQQKPELLATSAKNKCEIVGEVIIDPSAEVDPTARVGPGVYIAAGAKIGPGARVSHSIVLENVEVKSNAFIKYAIIGWNSSIGSWSRVEGMPNFTHRQPRDNEDKVTIFGSGVRTASEVYVRNSIVLPHKDLHENVKNRILL
ncbi:mannose-1-phosphate guanylyltransferase [Acrasis kona]|uniref:Mannose-1-phosphate guanylyltransferase n=1 Tax=Acrasis kona TaxID=1008807 RepID=A0AAW2ZN90_9EUKA